MRKVQYGEKWIEYSFLEREGLRAHYITVQKDTGVILKGKPLLKEVADKMILKKAPWIIKKLEVVQAEAVNPIVTGSRLAYLGKSYYVEVFTDPTIGSATIEFNHSRFRIKVPNTAISNEEILA